MKYYAVKVGRKIGIYYNWNDCKEQVDKFPKAIYKSFSDIAEANNFISGESEPIKTALFTPAYCKNSINCDGSYSASTEIMEFKIQDTNNGDLILTKSYSGGTNNLAEFLGLCYAMKFLDMLDSRELIIYTDSKTAMSWVKNKRINTVFDISSIPELEKDIDECYNFITTTNKTFNIKKWDTKKWGEIPSDFGRK